MAAEVTEQADVSTKKKPLSDDDKRRKKMVPGGLMKAMMRPGGGESIPKEGDQVVYHCTVRTLDGVVVQSSKSEFGGKGIPIRQVLGKSKILLGLLDGMPTMLKGEVAMFKIKSQLHYGEEDCPVPLPSNFPKDDELHFEIEMIDFFKPKVNALRMVHLLGIVDMQCNDKKHYSNEKFPPQNLSFGPDNLVRRRNIERIGLADCCIDGNPPYLHQVVTDDMGVVKKVISEGQGWETPREPYEVKAWISGKTCDGKLVSSHTEPYFFTFGKSEIPKGLEMGIGTMAKGEKALIYVTRQYLSESSFLPLVGNFEEIHFEVELVHFVQVRDMLGDGRLIKRRIRDGQGDFPMDCPLHDSRLQVHYKGMRLNNENCVFYDTRIDNNGQPLEFSSGEGLVPEGFEMCVRLMLPGEIALVTCPPDYAYDKFPRPPNVPEGAHVQWEIELLGFEMPQDWTGLSFRSIMDEAEKIRSTGNRLFKEGKFELAKAKYEKVLREFNHVNPQDDEEGKEFLNTRNLLNLNVAACYLKLGESKKSIEACNKVLDVNPAHAKALYRRGMAYMTAGDFQEARNDFELMLKSDKSSEPDASAALLKLKHKEQEVERKARKQFKGLFDKKPGEISEAGSELNNEHSDTVDDKEVTVQNVDPTDDTDSLPEDTDATPQTSWFSQLWPTGRRLFTALGVDRCSIL